MSITLTYWEDPRIKHTPDDFDGICTIVVKSVKQIPELIAARPARCTMISTERSAAVKSKRTGQPTNPLNPNHFKELWRRGQPEPKLTVKKCPLCGHDLA